MHATRAAESLRLPEAGAAQLQREARVGVTHTERLRMAMESNRAAVRVGRVGALRLLRAVLDDVHGWTRKRESSSCKTSRTQTTPWHRRSYNPTR